MILPWFQACVYWKKSVIWRYQLQPSIFYMKVLLCHGSTWSDPCVKDTVFISQHFLQSSIITTGVWLIQKNWNVCLFEESHCSQGAHLFHRTSCSNFCLRKHLQPFDFNLTISQQRLQLLIKYIKFFRRAIVHICTCKCDFGNSCFLQRAALSK